MGSYPIGCSSVVSLSQNSKTLVRRFTRPPCSSPALSQKCFYVDETRAIESVRVTIGLSAMWNGIHTSKEQTRDHYKLDDAGARTKSYVCRRGEYDCDSL